MKENEMNENFSTYSECEERHSIELWTFTRNRVFKCIR
jgi:hypothetical protein